MVRSESSSASKICVCGCVCEQRRLLQAGAWVDVAYYTTYEKWLNKGSMNRDTYSVLTFLFYEIAFIAYAYSYCAEADSERVCFPPVFKYPIKWNHWASVRPNYFIFIGYLRKKEIKSAHPHAPLYIWNPGSVTVVLAACSHVYLLACMQQCACLSGEARSIFVWDSVYHFSLCALGQNNGSEVCASSECPDYCVFAHARLSCRCSH